MAFISTYLPVKEIVGNAIQYFKSINSLKAITKKLKVKSPHSEINFMNGTLLLKS